MPCLTLNMNRKLKHQNCLLVCLNASSDPVECVETNEHELMTKGELESLKQNRPSMTKRATFNVSSFRILFRSKFKYMLLVLFGLYFVLNTAIVVKNLEPELPILDSIPDESYLKKHMTNHLELYDMGPLIIISFMKPLDYWNVSTFNRIRMFLNDVKAHVEGIHTNFEINWIQETYYNSLSKGNFVKKCKRNPLDYVCFYESFIDTLLPQELFTADVNYQLINGTIFTVNSSRVYLHYKRFNGKYNESKVGHDVKSLAKKYNFNLDNDTVIYSIVDVLFEQLEELNPSLLVIILISIESIVILSFFLMLDLRSIFILAVCLVSCCLAIVGNMLMLDVKFNFIVLVHYLLLPALLGEHFLTNGYLYLLEASDSVPDNPDRHSSKVFIKLTRMHENNRVKRVRYAFFKYTIFCVYYLVFILFAAFFSTNFCSTYSFVTLYKFLLITFFNLALHLGIFHPLLLTFFGPSWI